MRILRNGVMPDDNCDRESITLGDAECAIVIFAALGHEQRLCQTDDHAAKPDSLRRQRDVFSRDAEIDIDE